MPPFHTNFFVGMFEWKNNNMQFANRNITKFYLDIEDIGLYKKNLQTKDCFE
jgi:hypothetical protein